MMSHFFFAFLTSFLLLVISGRRLIPILGSLQGKGQPIRALGPKTHLEKQGTPTMGGVLIAVPFLLAALLFSRVMSPFVLVLLFSFFLFGFIGFWDDFMKIKGKSHAGISGKWRLLMEGILGAAVAYVAVMVRIKDTLSIMEKSNTHADPVAMAHLLHLAQDAATRVAIPFLPSLHLGMGGYILFGALVFMASTNAVNLTDGLDGLLAQTSLVALLGFLLAALFFLHHVPDLASHPFLQHIADVVPLFGALMGAILGFWWFNAHPASLFMGDVGSLAIGGFLGALSILFRIEILWILLGFVFVAEALSVILQVASFKIRSGKRIFKMAPLHHHFEQMGMHETKVTARFVIAGWVFLGLFLLVLCTK